MDIFSKSLTGLSLAMASSLNPVNAAQPIEDLEKQNVLFLFIDDLTYDGLNILGNHEIISPNLDKLISEGVNFTNAHIMGGWNGAISIASRSQLITGRYLWNTFDAQSHRYKEEFEHQEMWPQVMKQAGYKTFQTGKWHMQDITADQLFDTCAKTRNGGMPSITPNAYKRPKSAEDNAWEAWDKTQGGYWSEDKHWSEILADETIAYIDANKDSAEPLFMFCAFNAVHDPRQSPKEYINMYDVDKINVPENFQDVHPYAKELGCSIQLRDENLAPFPRTAYSVQKHRQEYYALISHMDAQVGRILAALKKNGMDKNTIIVFASDNGLAIGQHGLMGKQSMYEHSMRIPLAFVGPGIPKGETRTQLVYLQDLVPTIYDLAGIEIPEHMEFTSQAKVLKNKKTPSIRKAVYSCYMKDTQRAVFDGNFKLFFIPKAKTYYLFDLKNDPLEMNDLSKDPKYKKKAKKLAKKYLELAIESGDAFDITSIYPELF